MTGSLWTYYHASRAYVRVFYSCWRNQESFIFLSISFEKRSPRDDARVSAHGKIVEEKHCDGRDVEDNHEGRCGDPIFLGDEDREGDQDRE